MSAAQDTIAIVYSTGIAVITARPVDTIAIAVTVVCSAGIAVITNIRDILAPRDWVTGIDSTGIFVVAVFRCMHTSGSIVGVRGARATIITACQDMNAISLIAVIEGGGIIVVAIPHRMHA
jgi:hypothetical protein